MTKTEIKELVKQLTLEEKASLLAGANGWQTVAIPRLNIPAIWMSDGPHGLRKLRDGKDLSIDNSHKATCFPPAVLLACSWDPALAKKQGAAIGEEAQDQDLQIVLGPGNNTKRSPLCGRNFEYFSEDPYLAGHVAAGIIEGIQSKGIGTSLKHFAANNQETKRLAINEIIDERALREIYLSGYEYAVKKAKPTTLMCAYNRINGDHCSQSKWLLTDILRKEWGFKGFVMSDWGAVDNRAQAVYAGLDLEMPNSFGVNEKEIIKAVKGEKVSLPAIDKKFKNKLNEKQVDASVTRILETVFALYEKRTGAKCDYEKHHKLAGDIAKECMVLLKNDNNILPLKKNADIALIGEMAKRPRFQGGGSSNVNAMSVTTPFDAISAYANAEYAEGYSLDDDNDTSRIEKAVEAAKSKDAAVIVCGLPDSFESEGYDRSHLSIPESHIKLIEEVAKVQPNVVVVLCNGAPVEMPFADKCTAILESYLGGEASGSAIADILFGAANPCGKLAETFPEKLEHNPSYGNFGNYNGKVYYSEGVMVGYRWYDTRKIKPLFPFGYGLSYTSFEYSNLRIEDCGDCNFTVTCDITNTGKRAGKEIVQLYVKNAAAAVMRPEKELKGFAKLSVKPGETKQAVFKLDKRSFSYWNAEEHCWTAEFGKYGICVGASSADIRLTADVECGDKQKPKKITIYDDLWELKAHPKGYILADEIYKRLGIEKSDKELDKTEALSGIEWCMLRNIITMFGLKMTLSEMQNYLDEVNK